MKKHLPKFKVGDKVKNIWNENVYTVLSIKDGGYMLDDRYLPFNDETQWELAEKTESRPELIFKVGDRVKRKVVDPHNPATRYIYTVFEIENDKYCLDHNDHESWIPISAQDEFELVNEHEPTRRFNIGDIVQRGCVQYRITGFDGDDYVAIDTVKLEHGLKSPFDITKIGIYDDECELVKKAESNVQQIEPKFRLGDIIKHVFGERRYFVYEIKDGVYYAHQYADGNDEEAIPFGDEDMWEKAYESPRFESTVLSGGKPVTDIDEMWRHTLADLVGGVTQRNTDAFVWLIDETLRFMDCDAYVEDVRAGIRQFVKELKKRLGV